MNLLLCIVRIVQDAKCPQTTGGSVSLQITIKYFISTVSELSKRHQKFVGCKRNQYHAEMNLISSIKYIGRNLVQVFLSLP